MIQLRVYLQRGDTRGETVYDPRKRMNTARSRRVGRQKKNNEVVKLVYFYFILFFSHSNELNFSCRSLVTVARDYNYTYEKKFEKKKII